MNIVITFDIEFDINGAFTPPFHRKPRGRESLMPRINGQAIGLRTILDCLAAQDIRATFFVEALQSAWFGLEEMGDIAHLIAAHGHEIQLHLHPVWLQFDNDDWQSCVRKSPPSTATHDSLVPLSRDTAKQTISRGLEVFDQWQLPRPSAIRTGNLIVERWLYGLFDECNLRTSSSVGIGLHLPQSESLRLFSSGAVVDGVTELPVSSFVGADHLFRQKTKLATIIGTGRRELESLITSSRALGLPFIMLLSHVSEFLRENRKGELATNYLTRDKFEYLCAMISDSDDLRSATVSEVATHFSNTNSGSDVRVAVSKWKSVSRFLENSLIHMPNTRNY